MMSSFFYVNVELQGDALRQLPEKMRPKIAMSDTTTFPVVRFTSRVYDVNTFGQAAPSKIAGVQTATIMLQTFFLVALPQDGTLIWVPSALCKVTNNGVDIGKS